MDKASKRRKGAKLAVLGLLATAAALAAGGCGGREPAPPAAVRPFRGEEVAKLLPINSAADFNSQVAQSNGIVLVFYYAPWCGGCRQLGPVLNDLAESLAVTMKFVRVDVEKQPELTERNQVLGVPTVAFYVKGQRIQQLAGPTADHVRRNIDDLIRQFGK